MSNYNTDTNIFKLMPLVRDYTGIISQWSNTKNDTVPEYWIKGEIVAKEQYEDYLRAQTFLENYNTIKLNF